MRISWKLGFAGGFFLLSGSCYSFSGSSLPSHIKTIAVPTFEDASLEPEVATQLTTAVTERFARDGRLKLASEAQAGALLEGKVLRYENRVHNYTSGQAAEDYIVVVTLSIRVRDQARSRDLWKDEQLTSTAVYGPSGNTALSTEEAARAQAIQGLSEDIVSRTLEQW